MLFDAFFSGRKGNFLVAYRQLDMACMLFGPSRTRKNCYYNEKYHMFQRKCYFLTKQESIYFVRPCPAEGSNLTEVASLFCPKKKQGCDVYPTWQAYPRREFCTPGLVMNVPDLTSFYTSLYVKIWNEFVSLSEEEQDLVITRRTSSPQEKEINRQSTEEELVLTERGWSKCCSVYFVFSTIKLCSLCNFTGGVTK